MENTVFLNVKEVAARYGVEKSTIYRLRRQGLFPQGMRIGGSRLWELGELEMHEALVRKSELVRRTEGSREYEQKTRKGA